MSELVEAGMVYSHPNSPWACASPLVLIPGTSIFRFTVELRPSDWLAVKHQFLMANVEHDMRKVAGVRIFVPSDLSHWYWELPFPFRNCHNHGSRLSHIKASIYQIPYWIVQPTGNILAVDAFVHSSEKCEEIASFLVGWHLVLCKIYRDLVYVYHRIIWRLPQNNFELHAGKGVYFAKRICWCGYIVSKTGIKFDPACGTRLVTWDHRHSHLIFSNSYTRTSGCLVWFHIFIRLFVRYNVF